jgi:hypothetical protein
MTNATYQIKPSKARLELVLLASGTIFPCDAHALYFNTVCSASQEEIAPGAQVRSSSRLEEECCG